MAGIVEDAAVLCRVEVQTEACGVVRDGATRSGRRSAPRRVPGPAHLPPAGRPPPASTHSIGFCGARRVGHLEGVFVSERHRCTAKSRSFIGGRHIGLVIWPIAARQSAAGLHALFVAFAVAEILALPTTNSSTLCPASHITCRHAVPTTAGAPAASGAVHLRCRLARSSRRASASQAAAPRTPPLLDTRSRNLLRRTTTLTSLLRHSRPDTSMRRSPGSALRSRTSGYYVWTRLCRRAQRSSC